MDVRRRSERSQQARSSATTKAVRRLNPARRRAAATVPRLESLEERVVLDATLTIDSNGLASFVGSSVNNNLTISYDPTGLGTYTFTDTAEIINVDLQSSGVIVTGSGTNTVTVQLQIDAGLDFIDIDTDDGNDTVNLRSSAASVYVFTGLGADFVNAGSTAPNSLGTVGGLNDVFVGDGDASLLFRIDDSGNPTPQTITLSDFGEGVINFQGGPDFTYFSGTSVIVNGGSGGNQFIVDGTLPSSGGVTLNTGMANDRVQVFTSEADLTINTQAGVSNRVDLNGLSSGISDIFGAVNVTSVGGLTQLFLNNQLDNFNTNAVITSSQVSGLTFFPITYGPSVALLTLFGGSLDVTYDVQSTSAQTPIVIGGGGGNDTFNIGSGGSLAPIDSAVNVDGGDGNDRVFVTDIGSALDYTLDAMTLTRTGFFLNYTAIESLDIAVTNVGPFFDPDIALNFRVNNTNPSTITTLNLIEGDFGTFSNVRVNGTSSRFDIVHTDDFNFENPVGTVIFGNGATLSGGTVAGGQGGMTLDYSAYTTSVLVDLTLGTATGTGGVSEIVNLIGGQNNDTLIGDFRANVIQGQAGNDFIDGRGGDDSLFGESDNDTIFGGDGNDFLSDGVGNDTFFGQAGDDFINLFLLNGNQFVDGGAGTNTGFFFSPFTASPMDYRLVASASTPGVSELSGTAFGPLLASITAIQTLRVSGSIGDDSLTIDFLNGNPLPDPGPFGSGLTYLGDSGTNTLALTRTGGSFVADNEVYTPSGPSAGQINIDANLLSYVNVNTVNDTLPASIANFFPPSSASVVDVLDGPIVDGLTTTRIASGDASPQFAAHNVANKVILGVRSPDGGALNVNNPNTGAGIDQLAVSAGLNGVVNLQATSATLTRAFATTPNTAVNVGLNGTLENIRGSVSIDVLADAALNINNQNDITNGTVALGAGSLFGVSPSPILFQLGGVLVFNGGPGPNGVTYDIGGTAAGAQGTTINGGTNLDTFNVGAPGVSGGLDTIASPLSIVGGGNGDAVVLNDQGALGDVDYVLGDAGFVRSVPFGGVTYSGVGSVLLNASDTNNVIDLGPTSLITSVNAGAGDDSVQIENGITLNGGTLDGGLGTNTLDYALWATPVAVSLALGTATGTAGVTRFQNLIGSLSDDVLEGDLGPNVIRGGDGNDFLRGNGGDDQLFGEAGNDSILADFDTGASLVDGGDGLNVLTVNGLAADEAFRLASNGVVPVLQRTSPSPYSIEMAAVQQLLLNGGGGNNALTVDFINGNPIPVGINGSPGLVYDGGIGGDNRLALLASDGVFVASEETNRATGPGAGFITIDGLTLQYASLAPIDDTVPAINYSLGFELSGPQPINVVTGPNVEGFSTIQVASGLASPSFELVNLANKTNVSLNDQSGGAATYAYNVDIATPSTGLSTFTINGGAGDDTFDVVRLPAGPAFAVNAGDGNDVVTVNILDLAPGGNYSFDGGAGIDALIVNSGGLPVQATEDTITVGGVTIFYANFENIDALSFVVINTNDQGFGSLRQAILNSNANPGLDTITFAIDAAGPQSILVGATTGLALPVITDPVVIDGFTQGGLGYQGPPLIELDGSIAPLGASGIEIVSGGSTVQGLAINRFRVDGSGNGGNGILARLLGNNTFQGNYLGTDVTGTIALGNQGQGLYLIDSPNNLVGGTSTFQRNLISGNLLFGIGVVNAGSFGNSIQGNYVGTDVSGNLALPNGGGIIVGNQALNDGPAASNNIIGGTALGAGNLVSGNAGPGIIIAGSPAGGGEANVIQGNLIGTNAAGNAALPNQSSGVLVSGASSTLIGGTVLAARNVISGNGAEGVLIDNGSTNTNVQGNFIGTDLTGSLGVGNSSGGVVITGASLNIIGGGVTGALNVISGNGGPGVAVRGGGLGGNLIQGNFIGTDLNGTIAVANQGPGVLINDSPNTVIGTNADGTNDAAERNIIAGNVNAGVRIEGPVSTGNTVAGNFIGTDFSGLNALGNGSGVAIIDAPGNLIGGSLAAARNVISGNAFSGIDVSGAGASGNVVAGNFIGTDLNGTAALANGFIGINVAAAPNTVIGGTGPGARNIISGNADDGIALDDGSTNTAVQGNYIGTDVTGAVALPNGSRGIHVTFNVDGTTINGGNVISGNLGEGIQLDAGADPAALSNTTISGNFIGTDPAGLLAIGNQNTGIDVVGTTGTFIEGNTVSANLGAGIVLRSGTANAFVQNNRVGIDANSGPLGNAGDGITIFSADGNTLQNNLIAANGGNGIGALGSISGNQIINNLVGLPSAGGNQGAGIALAQALGNTVGGNTVGLNQSAGIILGNGSNNNLVTGNFVGLGSDGIAPAGNLGTGIVIDASNGNTIGGNAVANNSGDGLQIINGSMLNVAVGNRVGVAANGTAAPNNGHGIAITSGSASNTIGGPDSQRNIISGNASFGVHLSGAGTGNTITNNLIGTNVTGDAALGNSAGGVLISDTSNAVISGNVISGNLGGAGVLVQGGSLGAASNLIASNTIGLNSAQTAALPNGTGIVIESAANNTIQGNTVSGNSSDGIVLHAGASLNTILGNFIGTNGTGTAAFGNTIAGVSIGTGAVDNAIGGPNASDRNIISGNGTGVVFASDAGTGNVLENNFIGTNGTGNAALGNDSSGVLIEGASNGGSLLNNVISGNGSFGIEIDGASQFLIQNNRVGTNAAGTAGIGNGDASAGDGLFIFNGASGNTIQGNLFSGNGENGIHINFDSGPNFYLQNLIGTDFTGQSAVPNASNGMEIEGSGNTIQGNLLSGNLLSGIEIAGDSASGNLVENNRIGTNVDGTAAIPNEDGVFINGASGNTISGNLISGNRSTLVPSEGGSQVQVFSPDSLAPATGNIIQNNRIGTNFDGSAALVPVDPAINTVGIFINRASQTTITGNTVVGQNQGILIFDGAANNSVTDNNVGTNLDGTVALPNNVGVFLYNAGAGNVVAENVISGNLSAGLRITGGVGGSSIQDNRIGTNAAGDMALANVLDGIFVQGAGNTIAGNTISGNGSSGVQFFGSGATNNTLANNLIGLNATGTRAVPNVRAGVFLNDAPGNLVLDNTISGNTLVGLQLSGLGTEDNRIEDNRIGTNPQGQIQAGFGNRFGIFRNLAGFNDFVNNIVAGNTGGNDVSGPGVPVLGVAPTQRKFIPRGPGRFFRKLRPAAFARLAARPRMQRFFR